MSDDDAKTATDIDSGSTTQIDKIGAPSLNTSVESNHSLLQKISQNILQLDRHKAQSPNQSSASSDRDSLHVNIPDNGPSDTQSTTANYSESSDDGMSILNSLGMWFTRKPKDPSRTTLPPQTAQIMEKSDSPVSDSYESLDVLELDVIPESWKSDLQSKSKEQLENADAKKSRSLSVLSDSGKSSKSQSRRSKKSSSIESLYVVQLKERSQQWSPPWSRSTSQQIDEDDLYFNPRSTNTFSAFVQTDPELEMRGTQTSSTHTSLKKRSAQNAGATNTNSTDKIKPANSSNPTFSSDQQTEEKQMSKPIQLPGKPMKRASDKEGQASETQTLKAHKSFDMLQQKDILKTLTTLLPLDSTDHESRSNRLTKDKKSCPVCELFDEMYTLAGDLVLNSSIMMETYRKHRERHVEKAKVEITNFHKWNKKLKEMEEKLPERSEHRGKQNVFQDMNTDRLDELSPSKSRHSSEDLFSILRDDIYENGIDTSSNNKKSYKETSSKCSKEIVRHKRHTHDRRHKRSHSCRNSDDTTDEKDSSNSQNYECHCRRHSPQQTVRNCDCVCDYKKPKTTSCQCGNWDLSSNKQQYSSLCRSERVCYKHIDLDHDEDFHDLEPILKQILKDIIKTFERDQRQKAKARSELHKSSLKANEQRKEKAIEEKLQEIKSTKPVQRSSQSNENNSTQTYKNNAEEEESGSKSILENMTYFMIKGDSRKSKEVQTDDEKLFDERTTNKSSSTSINQHVFTQDPSTAEAIPDFITAIKSVYVTLCNGENTNVNGTPRSSGNRSANFGSKSNLNDPKLLELVTNIIKSQYLNKENGDEACNSGITSSSCSQEVLSTETQTNATVCESGKNVEGNHIPAYFYPVCCSNQQYQSCYPCQQHVNQVLNCGPPCACKSVIPLQEAFKQYSVCYQSVQMRQQCMSNLKRTRETQQMGCQRNSREGRLSTGTNQTQPQFRSNQVPMPCIVSRNSSIKPVTYVIPSNRVYWQNM